jgi:hypothetical protein
MAIDDSLPPEILTLFPAELRELTLMSSTEIAERFGISKAAAARRWNRLYAPYREAVKRYWAEQPRPEVARHRAHLAVRRERRLGRMGPPDLCERCGLRSASPLQAHHADITKPLDVEWLCPTCHGHADNGYTRDPTRRFQLAVNAARRAGYVNATDAAEVQQALRWLRAGRVGESPTT